MRVLVIRFLRVGLQTAHPCQTLFILLGLVFPALVSAVTRVAKGAVIRLPATLLVLLALLGAGRATGADWAANYNGPIYVNGMGDLTMGRAAIWATAIDVAGNVYIAGDFESNTFPLGGVTLTKIGQKGAFVAKLDASGAVIWANSYHGGSQGFDTHAASIAVDGSGNVYVGGYFVGGDLATPVLSKIGNFNNCDAFALKLDASGNTTWAKNFGGAGAGASVNSIAVDISGNVYLSGSFSGANLTTPALTKIGVEDAFAFKLDSSGNTIWAKNYGGAGSTANAPSITVDSSGNVYLGGYFFTATLTTPPLTKIGFFDAFAFKLDSSGNTTWAKNFGGAAGSALAYSIAVDISGNVYLGGYTGANLTTPPLIKIGSSDPFAFKLDSSGNTIWAKNFGGIGSTAVAYSIAVDISGNVYIGGLIESGNLTTPALSIIGTSDAFALKIDASGNTTWAKNYGGAGAGANANSIAVDGSGNVYLGGYFWTANLTTPALSIIGSMDAFIIKQLAANVPDAPTIGTATAGNAQATVTFTAPVSNGGSAITGYIVTSSPAGGTDSNTGTTGLSHVITGLTNGTAYTFTVTAASSAGTSAASSASNSVTPLGSQTITFGAAPTVAVGGTGTVSATGGASGNAVTFTSTTLGVCTISGSTITGISVGICTIAANQTGNATYAAASQVTQNIGIGISNQTISFGAAPSVVVGGTGTVSATGGASGNAVSFTSTTTGICTISGSTVTGVNAGTCTIAANQAGNANYAAASQVTQNITVTPAPVNGTCGTANGVAVSSAPVANRCATGSASAVAGSGPWTWSCTGSNGGTNASCSAPIYVAPPPPAPVVAVPTCTLTASPTSISAGGTSVLAASCSPAATSYSWSANTGLGSTVRGGTVSPTATTTYSVTGRNAGGTGNTSSVTVTVAPATFVLTVNKSGNGTGTITSNTSGIVTTLTATPSAGSYFEGWSGDCSGAGSCVVTMNAAKIVIATFKRISFDTNTSSNITPTSATASTTVNFKDDDKGKPGAVYVTAWVRFGGLATMGISAANLGRGVHVSSASNNPYLADEAHNRQAALYTLLAAGDPNAFVLIQLTPSGWQLVVDGQLIPYESGVLGDSLAYLSLLNNAATTNLLGAQFCVGYGTSQADITSAAEMISVGRMQTVLTIPDSNTTNTTSGSCNIAATVKDQAIEFYNADINHYFVTASSDEALFLNSKPGWNWMRTGRIFNTWLPSSVSGSTSPVCRFYGVFANGTVGSHFYTADPVECEYVKGRLDWGWGYEGDAFNAVKPTGGSCQSGTNPVYRVYNNGMGGAPNHRYVTSQTDVNMMVAHGWVSEGLVFCESP